MKEKRIRTARVSQRIDAQLDADLKAAALKLQIRRADIIRNALIQYLRNLEKGSSIKIEGSTAHTNNSPIENT